MSDVLLEISNHVARPSIMFNTPKIYNDNSNAVTTLNSGAFKPIAYIYTFVFTVFMRLLLLESYQYNTYHERIIRYWHYGFYEGNWVI
jgi:hypothetical protein